MMPTTRFALLLPVLLMVSACLPLVAGGVATTGVVVAQERTAGTALDDATIKSKITHLYINSGTGSIYSKVGVQVTEGRVLLTGSVDNADAAARAVQLAWEVDGVREVINEIQISDRGGPAAFASDAWITTQAKSRLIAEKDVRSVNYNIETVNNVVYVMGIAQNQEELARVLNVVSRVKGVSRVISHVRLKDDPRRTPPAEGATATPHYQQPVEPLTPQYEEDGAGYAPDYNDSRYNDRYGSGY